YAQSKTANILFVRSLAEKLDSKGLKAYTLHPGAAMGTSLSPHLGEDDWKELSVLIREIRDPLDEKGTSFEFKTLNECAATHVVAAFDRPLHGHNGAYLTDGNLARKGELRSTATNPDDADKLWKLSEIW
ncbi:hypothetical protein GQ43DRAFT_377317, partial [Delitschia confertaspora ATCC 74209]